MVLCCAVATPSLQSIATPVDFRTVWCVWPAGARILVYGAVIDPPSVWNNWFICVLRASTRPSKVAAIAMAAVTQTIRPVPIIIIIIYQATAKRLEEVAG